MRARPVNKVKKTNMPECTANSSSLLSINHNEGDESGSIFFGSSGTLPTTEQEHGRRKRIRSKAGTNSNHQTTTNHRFVSIVIPSLIVLAGLVSSGIIFFYGYSSARKQQNTQFGQVAQALGHQLEVALEEFTLAALWIRQLAQDGDAMNHYKFRQAYEYVAAGVLHFGSMGVATLVDNTAERLRMENETQSFVSRVMGADVGKAYQGFHNASFLDPTKKVPLMDGQENQLYAPVHYLEPLVLDDPNTYDWLDMDLMSNTETRAAIEQMQTTGQPVLTRCFECFGYASTLLMHPGVPLTFDINKEIKAHYYSLVEVRFDFLLYLIFQRANIDHRLGAFLYDVSEHDDMQPGSSNSYLSGAFYQPVNTEELFNVSQSTNVDDVLRQITVGLTVTDDNLWEVATQLDMLKRAAVVEAQLPDGSLVMGGALFSPYQPPVSTDEINKRYDMVGSNDHVFGSQTWRIVVTADSSDFEVELTFVILASLVSFLGCTCLAIWVYTSQRRTNKLNRVRAAAAAEKAHFKVSSARQAARNERELNDFIAHEVRNPLSAAISATSFVSSAVVSENTNPDNAVIFPTPQAQQAVKEDLAIVESSLSFINDLLRNMLDIHRASSNQMVLQMAALDVRHDVLEPVASMLYNRSSLFQVQIECPNNLVICSDALRLKQVILNLGRNAAKFVERGFVRLRAEVTQPQNKVVLYVEDSGPGIPQEKRQRLFQKFQQSLDTLQQGTGIGLAVCHSIVTLMGGNIELDDTYNSGFAPDCPGTRFVIALEITATPFNRLSFAKRSISMHDVGGSFRNDEGVGNQASARGESLLETWVDEEVGSSMSMSEFLPSVEMKDSNGDIEAPSIQPPPPPPPPPSPLLPEKLSVLFVDDDMMLRKLFKRSVKRVAPHWTLDEASNGETALRLVDQQPNKYDLIFMDQYMASVDKQLLGTETVRALRAKGVTNIICGLSANNLEQIFLEHGASAFLTKPFPCDKETLEKLLSGMLKLKKRPSSKRQEMPGDNQK